MAHGPNPPHRGRERGWAVIVSYEGYTLLKLGDLDSLESVDRKEPRKNSVERNQDLNPFGHLVMKMVKCIRIFSAPKRHPALVEVDNCGQIIVLHQKIGISYF